MTILLYILNVFCSSGQSVLSKHYASKGGSSSSYNINKSVAGIFTLLILGIFSGLSFHFPSILYGALYGIFLFTSMHTGFTALSIGPMALTSILASFSLIIPFIFGITVWGESLSLIGFIGMLFLTSSIFLLNFKKEGGFSFRWAFYAFATLAANGICSLIQKYHQLYFPQQYRTEFMLSAFITVFVIFSAITLTKAESRAKFKLSVSGLLSGFMNCAADYIVLYLAATEKASVLFPMVSVCKVLSIWLLGRIMFKEKLKLTQSFGLLAGILAIVLLNL